MIIWDKQDAPIEEEQATDDKSIDALHQKAEEAEEEQSLSYGFSLGK